MANSIEIYGDFDGGNPKDSDSIIQTGKNAFKIIPYSEDNDPNYKFRLDIKVINNSEKRQILDLAIDWQEPRFNHLRNYVYLKHSDDDDWSYHPMLVNRTQAMGSIECRAGETYICLHPKYNYGDYLRFIYGIRESDFIKKENIGLSPEGREIWLIKIGAKIEHAPKTIMLVSRIHPYETSGSFCIEGIINHFSEQLSPFTFPISPIFLLPMVNPDGVYNGFCKLTSIAGLNLSKQNDPDDSLWFILRETIDQIEPTIYCEFHNWMFAEHDGIYFLNWWQAMQFMRNMPSQERYRKSWKPMFSKKVFAVRHHGFKKYCKVKFGSLSVSIEYPWLSRSMGDMRKLGIDTFNALLRL